MRITNGLVCFRMENAVLPAGYPCASVSIRGFICIVPANDSRALDESARNFHVLGRWTSGTHECGVLLRREFQLTLDQSSQVMLICSPPMAKESKRYWLTFDAKSVQRPLVCEMSKKFDLIFDIRSATVTPQLGLMAIELRAEAKIIQAAVKWLVRHGVQVDPI